MADCQHDAGSKIEGAGMTDDLVKRLRELADRNGLMFADYDATIEAADRIEKLEAALDDVAGYLARADWYYLKPETRKALEGKDD